MTLLNVRLDPQDARMAAQLRDAGLPISHVVREAIRSAYERQAGVRASRRRASEIMESIYREHPDPPSLRARTRNLRDRASVQRVIRQRLRRRRP